MRSHVLSAADKAHHPVLASASQPRGFPTRAAGDAVRRAAVHSPGVASGQCLSARDTPAASHRELQEMESAVRPACAVPSHQPGPVRSRSTYGNPSRAAGDRWLTTAPERSTAQKHILTHFSHFRTSVCTNSRQNASCVCRSGSPGIPAVATHTLTCSCPSPSSHTHTAADFLPRVEQSWTHITGSHMALQR